MHEKKFKNELDKSEELKDLFQFAKKSFKERRVLGSQRALQYASQPILDKNSRLYNCASLHIDRVRCFSEIFFMLLSGCGVGFSVQKRHISKLPRVIPVKDRKTTINFIIPDTF